jgi:serpin B
MQLSLCLLLLVSGCGLSVPYAQPEDTGDSINPAVSSDPVPSKYSQEDLDRRIPEAHLKFAFDLYREIQNQTKSTDTSANDFLSPASIAIALAMTYNGAAGETREAMGETLHFHDIDAEALNHGHEVLIDLLTHNDEELRLSLVNSLWAIAGLNFKDTFMQINKTYYGAEIAELDLQSPDAPEKINEWVRKQTEGKIDKIIDGPINKNAILFLLNAVYFNGSWNRPFNEENTEMRPFYLSDQSKVNLPMMYGQGKYLYLEENGFQAVRIPYKGNDLGMYLFLPDQDTGLDGFLEQLSVESWNRWLSSFEEASGELRLPRFQIEYEISLKDTLKNLGMEIAFDEKRADFNNMIALPGQHVFLQEVKHKSYIDVQEKGTEAAAVTSVEVNFTSANPSIKHFQMEVNRPFFFVIYDHRTSTILFMGSVRQPHS